MGTDLCLKALEQEQLKQPGKDLLALALEGSCKTHSHSSGIHPYNVQNWVYLHTHTHRLKYYTPERSCEVCTNSVLLRARGGVWHAG